MLRGYAAPMATDLQRESVELLQQLIRFNTVNPPGNERAAIEHLERYLAAAGLQTELLAAEPERPNLVATLCACSPTSTPSSPIPRSGATIPGRAISPMALCGAAVPWT
jgi:hypothetical protein